MLFAVRLHYIALIDEVLLLIHEKGSNAALIDM